MFKKKIGIVLCLALALSNTNIAIAADTEQVEMVSEIETESEVKDDTAEIENVVLEEEGTEIESESEEDMTDDVTEPGEGEEDSSETKPEIKDVCVSYQTHIQNIGWQEMVQDGACSGTSGKSLRLEGIKIQVEGNDDLGITYQTHIQNIGWQDWRSDGEMSGTEGLKLRLEAIRIKLTGNDADKYSVYYRVHSQQFGWLGWAKDGEESGTEGYGYRLEALEIKVVKRGEEPDDMLESAFKKKVDVVYQTHIQNIGWQNYVKNGVLSGTVGKSYRLEALKIKLDNQDVDGNIEYRTHIQNIGWQNYVRNGELSGISGKALRMEAIEIKLTGQMAEMYDVYYRTHVQNFGWLGWTKNGQLSGSEGYGYRMESMQIQLLPKGAPAPGNTTNSYRKFNKADIFNNIKKHTFVPYVYGGTTTNGWDCSGFTQWAMRQFGVSIPRTSSQQSATGRTVNVSNMNEWKAGDLIFFSHNYSGIVGHVGLYLGDGMMMHALNPKKGTYITPVNEYRRIEKTLYLSKVKRFI